MKQGRIVLVEVVTLLQKPLQHRGDFQQQKEETGENPALNRTDGAAVSPSNIHHKPGTKVERWQRIRNSIKSPSLSTIKKKYMQSKIKCQFEEAFICTSRNSSNIENKKRTFLRTSIKYKVTWSHSHPFLKFSRLSSLFYFMRGSQKGFATSKILFVSFVQMYKFAYKN